MPPVELLSTIPDQKRTEEFVGEFGIHPVAAKVLISRGYNNIETARKFLFPRLRDITDPFKLKDMDKAASLFAEAIENKTPIVVYGDYDVDGVTSTALLVNFCRAIGKEIGAYLPHRVSDGYGISAEAVEKLSEKYQNGLLVSVDCGSTAVEEIKLAVKKGMKVVIIDHHKINGKEPEADAHINPHREGCEYPFKELAAVGLVLLFVTALRTKLRERGYFKRRSEPNLKQFLDLTALGTVADVVPLVGENRIFVAEGLKQLSRTLSPGLDALMHYSGCVREGLSTYDMSFRLGPRINAAGRIEHADVALSLLTCEGAQEAFKLAASLNEYNEKRREEEQIIFDSASQKISEKLDKDPDLKTAVIYDDNWHTGVIGIVASRLAEKFSIPIIIVGHSEHQWRGSARTAGYTDIYSILNSQKHLLLEFGGHPKAAGFAIEREKLKEFAKAVETRAKEVVGQCEMEAALEVDGELSLSEIDYELVSSLERLAPFGMGNPRPMFYLEDAEVARANVTRDGRHIQLELTNGKTFFSAIAFNMAHKYKELGSGYMVGSPRIENYLGEDRIKIVVHHIAGMESPKTRR